MSVKVCTVCGWSKSLDKFYTLKTGKFGVESWCKDCKRIKARQSYANNADHHSAKKANWRKANPEKTREIMRKSETKHRDKRLIKNNKWRAANPDYQKQWAENNKEKRAAILERFFENNPGYRAFHTAKYRCARDRAIPPWANLEKIAEIYKEASRLGLTVDHIVPLQGKNVCGLHVENNLQLLTQSQNSSKGNRFDGNLLDAI